MSEFTSVAKSSEIGSGEVRSFNVGALQIAIANIDGELIAFNDICTHRGCSLTDGVLEDGAIECPCHGSKFDVRTGAVLQAPATEPIATYSVRVADDMIEVDV
jgi:3-phenylpropionate/trans-cinnamate dioxygenase ferredoxin subunit